MNSTLFVHTGITYSPRYTMFEVAGESSTTYDREFTTKNYELVVYAVNLFDFNTTEFINPILIPMRGVIDNVTAVVSEETEGYEIDYTFWMGRTSGKEIYSVYLHYDDGSGEQETPMERGWDQFIGTLGPFAPGTELESYLVVTTYEGQVYTIGEREFTLGTATTTSNTTLTNTTSSTTGGEPIPYDMTLLMIISGAAVGVVVLVVVIVKFRK